ncbi:MAG: DUF2271 domain-containing protein [Bacteroidota bacterium]
MQSILLTGLFFIPGLLSGLNAQEPTGGEMTFTVRTVTANGNFSPKHVLAIWIEGSEGFVKTRKVQADKRKQYLYTWNSKTGSNTVDAITGSTLSSHQTHSVSWDCRDFNGNLVPDGTYTVYVEFTDQHAQGPIQTVSFAKGADSISLSPADEANFKDMELTFVPVSAPLSNRESLSIMPRIFPNPTGGMLTIRMEEYVINSRVKIYDLRGTIVYAEDLRHPGPYLVDISGFPDGLYVLKVESGNQFSEQVIIKEQ